MSDELDNLGAIEQGGTASDDLPLSNVYNVKVGGFGEPDTIKTYLCSVKVSELKDDISFYETLSRDKSWPVSQIIQREVDRIRASDISKDYILGQGRLIKYFPPLIIAILPRKDDGSIDLTLNYSVDNSEKMKELVYDKSKYRANDKIRKYFLESNNASIVDGLFLLEISKIFDFNLLCWDKNKYYAVVIDGQHRLDSLYRSVKNDPKIANYTQDVLFLDLSFLIRDLEQKFSPVGAVRRVFIDINTNAKKVGVVRQILMDDKDLAALFVQSMVDAIDRDGNDKAVDCFIVSQVMDWYSENLKHQFPHISGILSLYQIFDDYLIGGNLASISDLRSESKVAKWVTRMNDWFQVDQKIATDIRFKDNIPTLAKSFEKYQGNIEQMDQLKDEIDNEFRETEIFSFNYRVLDIAKETFDQKFLRPLVKVFHTLSPYQHTISIIEERKGFDKNNVLSKALLSSRAKLADDKVLREAVGDLKKHLEDDLNPKYYLIFTVLGQKVLFNVLFQRISFVYNAQSSEGEIFEVVDKFIEDLNRLFDVTTQLETKLFAKRELVNSEDASQLMDLGAIAKYFWEGIIYENGRIIYNTQGIRTFTSFIKYLLQRIDDHINNRTEKTSSFADVSYLYPRITRIIKRTFGDLDDEQIEKYVQEIVARKEQFIEKYIEDSMSLFNKNKAGAS